MRRGAPRDDAAERDASLWPASLSLFAVLAALAAVALAAAGLRRRRRIAVRLKKPDSSGRLYPRARAGTVRGLLASTRCHRPHASAGVTADAPLRRERSTAMAHPNGEGRSPAPQLSYHPIPLPAQVPMLCQPGGQLAVLLVRSRNVADNFVFPGGGIEPGETEAEVRAPPHRPA
jgi:hypothetical protein